MQFLNTARGFAFLACTASALAQETLPKPPPAQQDNPTARDMQSLVERSSRAVNLKAALVLDRKIPEVNYAGAPLKDVLSELLEQNGANCNVDWRALGKAGINPDSPVSMKLRDVSVRKLLELALNQASGEGQAAFYIDQGVIEITTSEIVNADMIIRTYPVTDLLVEAPVVSRDAGSARRQNGNGVPQRGAQARDGQRQNRGGSARGNMQNDRQAFTTNRAQELIDVITDTIAPDVWKINGGKATIVYFDGKLIINAPRSVHEAIGGPVK